MNESIWKSCRCDGTLTLLNSRTRSASYRFQCSALLIPDDAMPYNWLLRLTDFPSAIKNITFLPAAWGEKKSVTSSSKNVRPEAPKPWA